MADNKILQNVRIRMYRQGLGDCFLLTFTNSAGKDFNMVIDCGVLQGAQDGDKRINLAISNILEMSHNHLNVVAATHEHTDHISGFDASSRFFAKKDGQNPLPPVQVDKVWLAWTEKTGDDQVTRIKKKMKSLALAITASMTRMTAARQDSVRHLLDFEGDKAQVNLAAAAAPAAAAGTTAFKVNANLQAIMNNLRSWNGEPDYLEAGTERELADFGVKVHVLGPSRQLKILCGQADAAGQDSQGFKLNQTTAFMAAAVQAAGLQLGEAAPGELSQSDLDLLTRLSMPFDPLHSLSRAEVQAPFALAEGAHYSERLQADYRKFFQQYYGFDDKAGEECPEWRRIDDDWLDMGDQLALQMGSATNNTSLVLAIELVENGKVLLFVGDAEEPNWKAWQNTSAKLDDLLARTVVYKVGHHGSINATDVKVLKNMMTNPELVALIPVDVKGAGTWQFPAKNLYDLSQSDESKKGLLYTQTRGRIILNCGALCEDCDPGYDEAKFTGGKIDFDHASGNRLWVDYTLTL